MRSLYEFMPVSQELYSVVACRLTNTEKIALFQIADKYQTKPSTLLRDLLRKTILKDIG